jgi:hypothetical protein
MEASYVYALGSGRAEVPFGLEGFLGGSYLAIGHPERWVEWCRAQLARGLDTHTLTRACLLIGLMITGSADEAMAAADGLIDAAEATDNPWVLAFALQAYGWTVHDADPARSLAALRRGLLIARDSGNRAEQSHIAAILGTFATEHGDQLGAFEFALGIETSRMPPSAISARAWRSGSRGNGTCSTTSAMLITVGGVGSALSDTAPASDP